MTARKAEVAKPTEPEITAPPAAEVTEPTTPEVTGAADSDELTIVVMATITGSHDGQPWPARGQEVTLPKVDAEEYLRLGYAKPVEPA